METRKNLFFVLGEWWDARPANHAATRTTPPARPGRFNRLVRWLVPNGGTLLIVALLLLTQSLWARPFQATTNAPGASATTVNYQGRLADNAGVPLDGTYGMTFALYDEATDGNLIWGPEAHTAVPVSDGLFSVGLGSKTNGGIPTTTWNGDRYLEITVGGETLTPRELIRSVPIAGMALTVPDGAITNEKMDLSYWAKNSGDIPITSADPDSPDEVVSLDVNFPVDGTYLLFAKVCSRSNAGQQVIAEIWDENGQVSNARTVNTHHKDSWAGRQTSTIVEMVPYSAGNHTIKLVAYMHSDSSAGDICGTSKLFVIPFGR